MEPVAGTDQARWHVWLAAATAMVMTAACFSGALDNGFVDYDDWGYVFDPRTAEGLTAVNLRRAFTESILKNYHPLTWLSHMLDVELFGLAPRGHHAVSVALHAINAGVLLALLKGLGARTSHAWLLCLVFALHPLRVESVAWVSERKDVLSGFFYLLTLWLWVQPQPRRDRTRALLALSVIGALLSKPMAVSLPVVMALYDWIVLRASLKRAVSGVAPYAALAAVLALATLSVQGRAPQGLYPATLRLQTAAIAQVEYYLGNTIAPACLHAPYLYPEGWPVSRVGAAVAVLLLLTVLAIRVRHRWPLATFGAALWGVAMLPVSGLVAVGNAPAADRYTYIPTIGLLVAVVPVAIWLDGRAIRARRIVLAAFLLGALPWWVGQTRQQVRVWASTRTLFEHAVSCEPTNPQALTILARVDILDRDLEAAQKKLEIATREWPNYVDGWVMRGIASASQHRYLQAREEFLEVLSYDSGHPIGHLGLSLSLAALGEGAAADHEFGLVDFTRVEQQFALDGLAAGFDRLGQPGRAAAIRQAIVSTHPGFHPMLPAGAGADR